MSQKQYVFIPSQPTPNGPLHLGHIAGAFLSMDVMARFMREQGHEAVLVTGADRFDVYVRRSAQQEGRSCAESADAWTAQMQLDFETFQIDVGGFSNPAEPDQTTSYSKMVRAIFDEVDCVGALEIVEELAPYGADGVAMSGFGFGHCPSCGADVSGYFCEACARVMRPEEMTDPDFPAAVEWRPVRNAFFHSSPENRRKTKDTLAAMSEQSELLRIAFDRHYATDHWVRLTTNSTWGLKSPRDLEKDTVFFTGHSSEYEHMCSLAQSRLNGATHPFREGSDVISVNSFGFDNTTCVLGELAMALARPGAKPFDYYLPSCFLTLEGQKFSTSRKLAIFVHDIASMRINTDILRLQLARCDLRKAEADFRIDDLAVLNTTVADWWRVVLSALEGAEREQAQHPEVSIQLIDLQHEIRQCLQPENIRLADAARAIEVWMEQVKAPLPGHERAWLAAVARIVSPIMPTTGQHLQMVVLETPHKTIRTACPALPCETIAHLRALVAERVGALEKPKLETI